MKDLTALQKFADRLGLELKIWTDEEFIVRQGLRDGAVKSVGFSYKNYSGRHDSSLEFLIDSAGNCIGLTTEARYSYKKV